MIIKVVTGKEIPFENVRLAYPFHKMKVGDSFKLEGEYSPQARAKLLSASYVYGKRKGIKFQIMTETNEGVKEIWCYRIK